MHLTITPKGVTVDGTPLQVDKGALHIHDPDPDEVARVTLTLLPDTLTVSNSSPTTYTMNSSSEACGACLHQRKMEADLIEHIDRLGAR